MRDYAFSQTMRLNAFQIESLAKKLINEMAEKNIVSFREGKDKAIQRAIELIGEDYQDEKVLEDEVNKALDKLEAQGTEGFDRHKMFKMMKKKWPMKKGWYCDYQ